ncbi:uncharacterized protein zgc:163014 isoform X2 [Betta splendens]|uniref:Uncharacterized protein zgc:163014 isoform X2 n=1 Tax=Betta splendens TaxID=158456 RepID=A0A6P7LL45_BETSP|nr:uncharacterized protein zgc:163014 isoform X2 [Betta splendens]
MGSPDFYALWSLRDAPRQFFSKSNRSSFQVHVPLPLPKQLVIFGLGEWRSGEATISVEVLVSAQARPQRIGTLTSQTRCLIWEGDWNSDIVAEAAERGRRGVYGKIVLTVCREGACVFSSTPLAQRTRLFPEQEHAADLCSTLLKNERDPVTPSSSHLGDGDGDCSADVQVNAIDTTDVTVKNGPQNQTPRRPAIRKRGLLTSSFEDTHSPKVQASTPKKMRLSTQEEVTFQIKTDNRVSVTPSTRWSHTMCLSDPDTAILIGGETSDQNHCQDSLWKLELDSDFWFPMNSSASGPVPPCAQGHSATYDPDSKSVFVYGGLGKGLRYSELYILDTVSWKWRLVTAKGNVPSLAYHSAMFYKRELFVLGGVQPSASSGDKPCSSALYIFNPEFELWYKPIVDGDKPLPRFGHSATLLSQSLVIFGGRNTATYLNDVCVLDLGFMEYTAVKCGNLPPLPRGFHAALPVSDNRILVSGGVSAIGALQDVHIFNTDTNLWSPVASPLLSSRPRAGHSMISLGCSTLTDAEKHERGQNVSVHCRLLVFGGSDCCGTFYNDTLKCTVEIPSYK